MKIRFFNKQTGKDVDNIGHYVVDCEGEVYDAWSATRPDVGWEIINEDKSLSLEVQLDSGIVEAIIVLNKSPHVNNCKYVSYARKILQNRHLIYAEAIRDKSLNAENLAPIQAKHNEETK